MLMFNSRMINYFISDLKKLIDSLPELSQKLNTASSLNTTISNNNNELYRVDFGNSLTNINPTISVLGDLGILNKTVGFKNYKELLRTEIEKVFLDQEVDENGRAILYSPEYHYSGQWVLLKR